MKRTSVLLLAMLAVFVVQQGCSEKAKTSNVTLDKERMIRSDEAFSELSRQQGMKKAFIEYMEEDGVLLRPGYIPIVGADAIEFISQANDSAYILTWKPSGGDVSSSGDFGFTYGVYTLRLPDTTLFGTYANVWRKQHDGKWKFILDTGNEGIKADTLSTGQ